MPDDQYDKALQDALEANERRGDTAAVEKAARAAQEALRRQKPRLAVSLILGGLAGSHSQWAC